MTKSFSSEVDTGSREENALKQKEFNRNGKSSGSGELVPGYAEIGITTNFSFLRGGSDPRAYVHQASKLEIPVIGIADHNTLAGVVRAWKELDNPEVTHKPKLLI